MWAGPTQSAPTGSKPAQNQLDDQQSDDDNDDPCRNERTAASPPVLNVTTMLLTINRHS